MGVYPPLFALDFSEVENAQSFTEETIFVVSIRYSVSPPHDHVFGLSLAIRADNHISLTIRTFGRNLSQIQTARWAIRHYSSRTLPAMPFICPLLRPRTGFSTSIFGRPLLDQIKQTEGE